MRGISWLTDGEFFKLDVLPDSTLDVIRAGGRHRETQNLGSLSPAGAEDSLSPQKTHFLG